jgi:hypothetical protein
MGSKKKGAEEPLDVKLRRLKASKAQAPSARVTSTPEETRAVVKKFGDRLPQSKFVPYSETELKKHPKP